MPSDGLLIVGVALILVAGVLALLVAEISARDERQDD
jgi:hypothetical protein